jgi:hypothetical protein
MPAKDKYHDAVRNALTKDGWVITHDPFHLSWGGKEMYVDLGAEYVLAAERLNRRIAVEVKSFLGQSLMDDLEKALGQFVLYRSVLSKRIPIVSYSLRFPSTSRCSLTNRSVNFYWNRISFAFSASIPCRRCWCDGYLESIPADH